MPKSQTGGSLAAIVKEALVPLLLLGAQDKVKNKNVFSKKRRKTKRKRLRKKKTKKGKRKKKRKSRRRRR
jgi:hypothetical protein